MRLLLHTCCAPCAIYPVNEAKKDNFDVTGFFCNPNIYPEGEYNRRRETAREFFESEGLALKITGVRPLLRAKGVRPLLGTQKGSDPCFSCLNCWTTRMKETAGFAKSSGFDAFTTTLLGSPYQGHDEIKEICEGLSRENRVRFYYKDFRAGFRDAQGIARKRGMYRQKYCGCAFSMVER